MYMVESEKVTNSTPPPHLTPPAMTMQEPNDVQQPSQAKPSPPTFSASPAPVLTNPETRGGEGTLHFRSRWN